MTQINLIKENTQIWIATSAEEQFIKCFFMNFIGIAEKKNIIMQLQLLQ